MPEARPDAHFLRHPELAGPAQTAERPLMEKHPWQAWLHLPLARRLLLPRD